MVTYKEIFKLSMPIMIGSAAQNIITMTDVYFLGKLGTTEFAAIGIVGIFYLMITTIGYNFSKAGQIMIARRMGEGHYDQIGGTVHNMIAFALGLSILMFIGMQLFAPTLFGWFIHNPDILKACNEYLFARSFGVFFSYMGVVAVALYTGIARTNVIIYNSIILGIANALLNYGLIFGNWGFPKMGMAGAAWASTFSEVLAFALFTIYLLRDKFVAQNCRFIARPKIDFALIKAQISLSLPIVFQSIVGIGSWQVFFFMVEGMDEQGQALAVSNLLRTVYMVLMIPSWGFASGMNTIASNLIGQERHTWVLPAIFKTAVLCLGVTMFLSFATIVAFPDFILTQFVQDPNIVNATKELVWVLVGILATVAVGSVYFNGMVGTGATRQSLWIQIACCVFYQAYTIASIKFLNASLPVAWLSELFYWLITLGLSYWYLASGKWKNIQV